MGKAELFNALGRKMPPMPVESLRAVLDALERDVSSLAHSDAATALELPVGFDQAAMLLLELQARGAEVKAEQARFEMVTAQYRRQAALFLRRIGGAAVLSAARERAQPEAAAWWWTVDLWLAAQRRAVGLRRLLWGALAAAVLAALGLVYARFLAPDPTARAVYGYQFKATDLAARGEIAPALEQTELALALDPTNPELLTLKGVLLTVLGDAAAPQALVAAEEAYGDREKYLARRGQLYMQLGQLEAVWDTAEALLAINERSAIAYLFRGMAAEGLGNVAQARADYERAGELAQEQQLPEIYVTSRNLLGNLLMQTEP